MSNVYLEISDIKLKWALFRNGIW